MQGPYVTLQEFADYVAVSRSTVKRWVKEGLPVLHVGRIVRVPLSEAQVWLVQQRPEEAKEAKPPAKVLRFPTFKSPR